MWENWADLDTSAVASSDASQVNLLHNFAPQVNVNNAFCDITRTFPLNKFLHLFINLLLFQTLN